VTGPQSSPPPEPTRAHSSPPSSSSRETTAALATLAPSELDRRVLPPQELWGTGQPHEISRRDALVESVRHAALHLGELRLTRDLAVSSA